MRAAVAKDRANLARMYLDSPHVNTAEAPGGAKGKAQDWNRCSYCTKLHILSDTIGRLSRVLLTLGQVGDVLQAWLAPLQGTDQTRPGG